jgi:hypothetical protein
MPQHEYCDAPKTPVGAKTDVNELFTAKKLSIFLGCKIGVAIAGKFG